MVSHQLLQVFMEWRHFELLVDQSVPRVEDEHLALERLEVGCEGFTYTKSDRLSVGRGSYTGGCRMYI